MNQTFSTQRGSILIQVIMFSGVAIILLSGLVTWGITNVRVATQTTNRELALQIAESGIDYYRWHLAHAPQDYQDGATSTGPYVHDFKDKDGNVIGSFTLTITPPALGSTLVTIKSTGKTLADTGVSRSIVTRLAKPSLAKYSLIANEDLRFGPGTEIFGLVHSNGGIRFDGLAHNIVSSAKTSYDDQDHTDTTLEFAVHTHVTPPPGSGLSTGPLSSERASGTLPARPDIFVAGRQFPVPAIDFPGIIADLAQIKADAVAQGKYYGASGTQGYYILLKTNDTFDIYKVNSLVAMSGGDCSTNGTASKQTEWGSWSINTKTLLASSVPFPANGLLFVEDNLWIEGQISSARLTVAAAKFPDSASTRKSITINNNLTYTNYDSRDSLALIAQNNINVGYKSADTQRIDAALVAQNGRAGRYYYSSACNGEYSRTALTLYGMVATNQRYGFAYSDSTGYTARNIIYDASLLYSPPPSFPLTSDQYSILSWEEVK